MVAATTAAIRNVCRWLLVVWLLRVVGLIGGVEVVVAQPSTSNSNGGCSIWDEPIPCVRIGLLTDYSSSRRVFLDAISSLNTDGDDDSDDGETTTQLLRFEGVVQGTANEPLAAMINTQTMVERQDAFCIIGPGSSALTIPVQKYLQTQNRLHVGYGATAPTLSNKKLHPTFARIVASDKYQSKAMIDLAVHYRWEEIAVLYINNMYGIGGWSLLKQYAQQHEISITSSIRLDSSGGDNQDNEEQLRNALVALRKSGVKIIYLFVTQDEAIEVFKMANHLSMTNSQTVWIVSDSVVGAPNSSDQTELIDFFQTNPSITRNLIRNVLGVYPDTTTTSSSNSSTKTDNPYLRDAVMTVATLARKVVTETTTSVVEVSSSSSSSSSSPPPPPSSALRALFQAKENLLPVLQNLTIDGLTGTITFDKQLERSNPPGYLISQLVPPGGGGGGGGSGLSFQPLALWNNINDNDSNGNVNNNKADSSGLQFSVTNVKWGLQASATPPTSRAQPMDCSTCRPRDNLTIALLLASSSSNARHHHHVHQDEVEEWYTNTTNITIFEQQQDDDEEEIPSLFLQQALDGLQYAASEMGIPTRNIVKLWEQEGQDGVPFFNLEDSLLEANGDTKPDFIIILQPNATRLMNQVSWASSYGIPVITIGSSDHHADPNTINNWQGSGGEDNALKPLAHVGVNNTRAGELAAEEAIQRGVQVKLLCLIIIHNNEDMTVDPASTALLEERSNRCMGVAAVASRSGLEYAEILIKAPPSSTASADTVVAGGHIESLARAAMSEHPSADGVIITSSDYIEQLTTKVLSTSTTTEQGRNFSSSSSNSSSIHHIPYIVGSFDLTDESATAVELGMVDFVLSQNEFMQGHLSFLLGALLATAQSKLSQYMFDTGPSIIDSSNLGDIKCSVPSSNIPCLSDPDDPSRERIPVIGVVTHAQTGDTFWDPVFRGIRQAATDSLTVLDMEFSLDLDSGNSDAIKQVVETLIRRPVDALIMTIVSEEISEKLNEAGIPFIFFNTKPRNPEAFDRFLMYFGYVGQDDYQAAHDLVLEASRGFSPHVLLVDKFGTQPWARARLDGALAGIQDTDGSGRTLLLASVLGGDGKTPEEEFQIIKDAIQADDRINLIFTAHTDISVPCTAVVQQLGRSIPIVTFDTLPITIHQVENGEISHTVDQLPYMQGYMSIMKMATFLTKRAQLVTDIATGPYFISPRTLEQARCTAQLSTTCSWWLCEKGSYYDQKTSTCFLCPPGTYQPSDLAVGDASCLSCPIGTFNPNEGSSDVSDCMPASNGTFVNVTGASKSVPCDEGVICGLASTSNTITSISDYDLYTEVEEESSSLVPESTYPLIAVACFVGAMMLLLIVSAKFIIAWWPWVKKSTEYCDQYTGMVDEEAESTVTGGLITLFIAVCVICYMIWFATAYFAYFDENSSLLPGVVALDGNPVSSIEAVPFKVEITAIGGVGECSEESVQVVSNYARSEMVTTFELTGDRCAVSWSVEDLTAEVSTVTFTILSPVEFASAIAWQVSAPSHKVRGETDAVNGVVLPEVERGEVLKGPEPAQVAIAAYHTIYHDEIEGTRVEGAIQQIVYNETGSTANEEQFHKQEGLKIEFEFRWSTQFVVFVKSRYQPIGSFFAELTAVWEWFNTVLFLITTTAFLQMTMKAQFVVRDAGRATVHAAVQMSTRMLGHHVMGDMSSSMGERVRDKNGSKVDSRRNIDRRKQWRSGFSSIEELEEEEKSKGSTDLSSVRKEQSPGVDTTPPPPPPTPPPPPPPPQASAARRRNVELASGGAENNTFEHDAIDSSLREAVYI